MAIRRPPHLVPRSAAGVPVESFAAVFSRLPVPLLDHVTKVMQRVWFGDLRAAGLPVPAQGIYTALRQDGRIPTRRIQIVSAVRSFDGARVMLADGAGIEPDTVISATGYRTGLKSMVGQHDVLDDARGDPSSTDCLLLLRVCGSPAMRSR
jgi:putative flavoprotein involved in K+ transport